MSFPEACRFSILQLLQLADSALPVGSMSHSFGLEALVFDEDLSVETLGWYLEDCLSESLLMDAVYCREAHSRGLRNADVTDLNQRTSALRLARESREASFAMGRRFAALVAALDPSPALTAFARLGESHYPVAFGYTLGVLGADSDLTTGAFLHQSVLNTISAAQRLLPLGQIQASRIAWDLKPVILEAVQQSQNISFAAACNFAHLPEMASMRHPCLPTRLFIS